MNVLPKWASVSRDGNKLKPRTSAVDQRRASGQPPQQYINNGRLTPQARPSMQMAQQR
jgi:hypothetical protein